MKIFLASLSGLGGVPRSTSTTGLLNHAVRRLGSDESIDLQQAFAGQVALIVNTASHCGFTDQYHDLEALYAAYRDRGFVVLGFPSNDFGEQEPGDEQQIADFCRSNYGVQFPMFAKTRVRKGRADPLFEDLAQAAGRYPLWNFHKYLIDRQGNLIDDFLCITSPRSRSLVSAIERAL